MQVVFFFVDFRADGRTNYFHCHYGSILPHNGAVECSMTEVCGNSLTFIEFPEVLANY